MTDEQTHTQARLRALGWWGLTLAVLGGLALEAAHGWKAPVLDDPLAHSLARLGHSHAAGMSLLLVCFAELALPRLAPTDRWIASALTLGWAALPLGFVLGIFGRTEMDPGAAIVLAPIGGVATLAGLVGTSLRVSRRLGSEGSLDDSDADAVNTDARRSDE